MDKTILKITSAIIAEFYLLVILAISTPLLAQDNGMSQVLKTLVPPTPEAAGMIRYGEYPVSPATGVPAIDIPLYTVVCDGYELPVSISYHASGIKVNDVASEVGLGWTLNAAGIVSRNICGAPDRIDGTSGWVTSKSALDAMITAARNSYTNIYGLKLALGGQDYRYDTESDRYFYSFGGKSGYFRYNFAEHQFQTIPYSRIKVENSGNDGFVITDTDGTVYHFMQQEASGPTGHIFTTGWRLTRIVTPETQSVIEFEYEDGGYSQYMVSEYAHSGYEFTADQLDRDAWMGDYHNEWNYNCEFFSYYTKLLKTIKWKGNRIELSYSTDRLDKPYAQGTAPKRLSSLAVINNAGQTVRTVTFGNSGQYLGTSAYNRRMMLRSLTVGDSSASETYRFTYNEQRPLPDYQQPGQTHYCQEDYWGYYNGRSSIHFIPSAYVPNNSFTGADRSPNATYAQTGILTSVQFPTGGSTSFTYEGNTRYSQTWGGLRVKTITQTSNDTIVRRDVYSYDMPSVRNSITFEMFQYETDYYYFAMRFYLARVRREEHQVSVSNPVIPMTALSGNPIFYDKVVRDSYDGRGTLREREESRYLEDGELLIHEDQDYDEYRFLSDDRNFDQGIVAPLLLSSTLYNADNGDLTPVRTIENTYSVIDDSHPSGLVRHFIAGVRLEKDNVCIMYSTPMYDYMPYDNWNLYYSSYHYHNVWAMPCFRVLGRTVEKDLLTGITNTTAYGYDSGLRTMKPVTVTTHDSRNRELRTSYTFPFNYPSGTFLGGTMTSANYRDAVVRTDVRRGNTIMSSDSITYGTGFRKTALSGSIGGRPMETRTRISYNGSGLISRIIQDSSDTVLVEWDSHGLNPTAVTRNGDRTAYSWKPLVGVTCVTDQKGMVYRYEYDALRRLTRIRDVNYDIVSEYEYTVSDSQQNHVEGRTMLSADGSDAISEVRFFDGLGRQYMTATNGLNHGRKFVYTMSKPDYRDRTGNVWRPVVGTTTMQHLTEDGISASASSFYSDQHAVSHIVYDGLGRSVFTSTPGQAWFSNGLGKSVSYATNGPSERVKCYNPSNLSSWTYYPDSTLLVVTATDEEEICRKEYKDKEGRTVLEISGNQALTYYVYNDLGQLVYVLQPEFQNDADVSKYAFSYTYDTRGRCSSKTIPGTSRTDYSYDDADRVVRMQDGVLRASGRYRFFEYDHKGRITRQYAGTSQSNRSLEQENYHDGYGFVTTLPATASHLITEPEHCASAVGLQTGCHQKTADGDDIYSVTYYDDKARPICIYDVYPDNRVTRTERAYEFCGDLRAETVTVYSGTSRILTAETSYTYYNGTRLPHEMTLALTDRNNTHVSKVVKTLTYDDLGNITVLDREGTNADMSYTYDLLHGWLTGISSGGGFAQNLYREAGGQNARFNGSVSAMSWRAPGTSATRRYEYTYDGMNRLTEAVYSDSQTSGSNKYGVSLVYDLNTNITSLNRRGMLNNRTFGTIDNLTVTRTGNQLKKVEDSVSSLNYTGASDFVNGSNSTTEYTYNQNGALTKDANRGITGITYDESGNVRSIIFSSGSRTDYVYSSNGRKLRTVHIQNVSGSAAENTTDYLGNLILENSNLSRYAFPGGYVSFSGGAISGWHYYVQDYQGNNRMVVSGSGNVEQVTHYYPYGGVIGDISTDGDFQKNKFLGKELDRKFGLDWYDDEARMYDAIGVPRFTSIDPLAEKYYHLSPYSYCGGEPVNHVDYDGKEVKPCGSMALSAILNTLPKDSHRFVVLDANGYIDLCRMSEYNGESQNYQSLMSLVRSKVNIIITTEEQTKFISDGNMDIEKFEYIAIEDDFIDDKFDSHIGNTVGETGNLGVAYMPTNNGAGKSSFDYPFSIHINLNPHLSKIGAAETFSHEAYGHALIYVETGGDRERATHQYDGYKDRNQELIEKSIKARKETIQNLRQ